MNKKQTNEANMPEGAEVKPDVTKLPRMEMYAVLGLELGQKIYEKLQEIEESLETFARQKARELNPEQSEETE